MASVTATISKYTQFNQTDNKADSKAGWHSWQTGQSGGYASTWDAVACKFKIDSYSGTYSNTITKAKIKLKHRKSGSGTFYFYIVSTDPTGVSLDSFKKNNSAFGSAGWSGTSAWKTDTYTVNCSKTLTADTTYYLVVCGTNTIAEIGVSDFGLSFEYSYINDLSKPSKPSAPTNNHDNTFNASCSEVSSPTGNTTVTTLQYKIGSNGSWTNAGSAGTRTLQRKSHGLAPGVAEVTVYARVSADPTYGSTETSDSSTGTKLKNYVAPSLPAKKPTVTKTKTRFTIKEPWVVSWTGEGQTSTQVNDSSPVAGYRIVLKVKKAGESSWNSVPIKDSNDTTISRNPSSSTWHTIDTKDLGGKNSITIYPDKQKFAPGDQVVVGIRPYILWGAADPPHNNSSSNANKLFNEAENDYKYTDTITVQNAGIVRLQVGNDAPSFKEGRVWVKMPDPNNTNQSKWYEADIVKVKTSGGWKESE